MSRGSAAGFEKGRSSAVARELVVEMKLLVGT